jgi:hypothetical protein
VVAVVMAFPETPIDCAAPGLVARRMAALPAAKDQSAEEKPPAMVMPLGMTAHYKRMPRH